MSFIPDGFGECTVSFEYISGPSNPMAVVFGYQHGGGVNPSGHAETLADAWVASISTITLWTDNLLISSFDCVENPGGVSGGHVVSQLGTESAMGLPPQVAVLVRKVTDTGGRAGRGRMYLPGLTISHVLDGGFVHPTSRGLLQAEVSDFRSSIAASDLPMHVLHAGASPAPSSVVALEVQAILATQRRRIR